MTSQSRWQISREKYLTDSHYRALVAHCRRQADHDALRGRRNGVVGWMFVHLGLAAGLRVAELTDLRCGDVHVGYGESHLVVRNGKGGKRGEVVVGKQLKTHLKQFLAWKEDLGEETGDDDFLLVSERRQSFSRSGLQRKFKTMAKAAGLPGYLSIHATRHTFAVRLLGETKNIRLVQKQLRHSSVVTTSVYADVLDGEVQEAMDALD